LNAITQNQVEREFFSTILDNETMDLLFDRKCLIFVLIDKKERKLLKQVLTLSPCLIDQLDEDGNDPLLHLCLKVGGCRHRIIEMLIKMGSNLERRNLQGQNFIETLQLKRNKKLYEKLLEHEII
jgi:ankyrin repeat protein